MRIKWNLYCLLTIGILFLGLLFGLASACRAETKEERMYFSILGVENYIEGDFDGKVLGVFEGSEGILVRFPKIKSGRGFGILIGGINGNVAGELYYTCSNHDISFWFSDLDHNGVNDHGAEDAIYYNEGECQVLGGNIKYFFANLFNKNLRVFGQFGFFVPRISIQEGAYKLNDPTSVADATFTGYGADLGLGILIHLHPNLAINGGAIFRGIRIKEVTAFDQDRVPTKSTYGTGRNYSIGLNYYF